MRRRLRSLAIVALLAGLLTGTTVAVLERDTVTATVIPHGAPAGGLPREQGPLRTADPGVRLPTSATPRVALTPPRLRGRGAEIIGTVADPYGGPPWAVRRFTRDDVLRLPGPREIRRGTVDCVQVGRLLRGRFVWIAPGARRAAPVDLGTTDNTVCEGSGRSAVLGALRIPIGRVGASEPTIAATVVWGLSRRPGADVELVTRQGARRLVDIGGGARLEVRRGNSPVGAAQVRSDGRAVPRGLDNQPFALGTPNTAQMLDLKLEGLRIDGVVADPASDRPRLLVTGARGDSRCFALVGSLVAGEPVRVLTRLGALAPDVVQCQTPRPVAPGRWSSAGGFAGSGGAQPSLDRRRARERRALPGYTASVIAVPREVVALDLRDDLGVRTVRTVAVGRVRLAVSLAGGDLPLAFFAGPMTDRSPTYVGRTAAGRVVRLTAGP